MPLIEEFEKSGNWLFRWRSYLPLALLLLFVFSMQGFTYLGGNALWDLIWNVFCLAVSLFGLGIRIYTIGHTPAATSGRNTKKQVADALNTSGIYSMVRHPLYLGNFFMFLGLSLYAHNWWATAVFCLMFWLYYERIMLAEEAFLRRKFGEIYVLWADKTPPFFPRFVSYRKAELPFSWKKVLRREYNGFFALIISMFILETYSEFIVNGHFSWNPLWLSILALGFLTWLILRTLKKKTKLLIEKGR